MDTVSSISSSASDAERAARMHLDIVASGAFDSIDDNVTSDYWDHQAGDTPEDVRQRGPAAFESTITWLHTAFTDMSFDVHDAYVDGERVALYVTFHARQHGPFVIPGSGPRPAKEFPATGRTCSARAVHLFHTVGTRVSIHDAVRDDMAMAGQLGWIPS